ncbi:hypothetical protein [Streptomyces sedi]|uniref:Secreted protein n=1 Tax=Streptomyces sedi TaxID=555059 RepID=A0A5C4UQF7_9ACTN|nr:hypothetical protein FH715_26350 [Streptomyces sedi]
MDGTLLPYASATLPTTDAEWDAWQHPSNPALATVDPAHGPRLLGLECALMWATGWMAHANEVIAPLVGLPRLPVCALPDSPLEETPGGPHWKTETLVATAAGRPFVWVDDEIGASDRDWVAAHHGGPALLHRVDPLRGLGERDFAVLTDWLRGLGTAG